MSQSARRTIIPAGIVEFPAAINDRMCSVLQDPSPARLNKEEDKRKFALQVLLDIGTTQKDGLIHTTGQPVPIVDIWHEIRRRKHLGDHASLYRRWCRPLYMAVHEARDHVFAPQA